MNVLSRNNVHISGQGRRPVVFAHGYGCDQVMWRHVSPAFEPDYQVVLFDYVGGGGSDSAAYAPERYSALPGYAQDLVEVCSELDLFDAVLVGHSVSSMICLLAAKSMRHRVSSVVMVCPSARYLNDPPSYEGGFEPVDIEGLIDMIGQNQPGWAGHLAGVVAGNPDRPELAHELEASFCSMSPSIARRFASVTFLSDNRDDLAGFDIPTLILQTVQDAVAPPSAIGFVHQQLVDSTLQRMLATGHCPQLSHPDETIHLIRNYLAPTLVAAN